ncbi:MAG: DNA-processing protein DprA [Burkholderiaceae bacterium]|jgi:DNA processing protein|nr:DNA-processing protein DprA [Burkholderiaceae bacterium]
MDRDELIAWVRLGLTPGVGNDAARRLLAAFGLPQAIFSQSAVALRELVSPAQAGALTKPPEGLDERVQDVLDWLAAADAGLGRALVTLGDARYPASLLEIEDPPLMLYLLGQVQLLDGQQNTGWPVLALALVGSRNPTPQGALNARQFARTLAAAGLTVVSGLALGVDGAAHEGALASCDERQPATRLVTLAVVGTGLDRVYPRQHRALAHRIAAHGLIVSEFPLGTPPLPGNFPKRNRLIAGLTRGTLVVEAALRSGSLITARLASEQGKEVFAIPGSIHSPQSRGCHALIRQGAKLVETAEDVLEELRWPHQSDVPTPHDSISAEGGHGNESTLLAALGADPVGLDALQARTGLDTATLQARLLALELDGHVGRLPGGLFQRLGRG